MTTSLLFNNALSALTGDISIVYSTMLPVAQNIYISNYNFPHYYLENKVGCRGLFSCTRIIPKFWLKGLPASHETTKNISEYSQNIYLSSKVLHLSVVSEEENANLQSGKPVCGERFETRTPNHQVAGLRVLHLSPLSEYYSSVLEFTHCVRRRLADDVSELFVVFILKGQC